MNWSSSWTSGHRLESLWLCDCASCLRVEPVKALACCSVGPNWQGHKDMFVFIFHSLFPHLSLSLHLQFHPSPLRTSCSLSSSSTSCICSCKWHCKQNCKAHYVYFAQRASHANIHWNKLMIWFKVSVLWSTINTGTFPETLIRYPAIALSHGDFVAKHLRAASTGTGTPGSAGEGGCLFVPSCLASLDTK